MSEIKNKEILRLFPSLVFKAVVDDSQLLDQLIHKINYLSKTSTNTSTSKFTTADNLQEDHDFTAISNLILAESNEVLNFFAVSRDNHYISNMWAHVTKDGHRHAAHIHPNSYLSGILYLQTPEQCGNTIFLDPRAGSTMIHPDFTEENYFNMNAFIHKPKKGTLLIWNSWLPHMVDQASVKDSEHRIVLAFNIMLKASVTRSSEKIVY